MKKYLSFLLSLSLLTANISAIDVMVDSTPLEMDVPPQIIDNRTLVPLRAIFEELGAQVDWDNDLEKVTATRDNTIIELTLNQTCAYVNGVAVELDVPAQVVDNRTLVPVRFVSEALDATVYWVQETQTVRIASQVFEVTRVVDGDTIIVDYFGEDQRVRLIGIDTPESVHPDAERNEEAGLVASDYTKLMLEHQFIELEFDVSQYDMYNRMLAYVYLDGVMFNKTLLQEGYAVISTYKPNVKYLDDFNAIMGIEPEPEVENSIPSCSLEDCRYVGSVTSDKYHYLTCRYATSILDENLVRFDSIETATHYGYQPCGVCKPG